MAKELPFFKFEPAEYLAGNVSFCSLSAQGLFINLCCYYWQRECDLTEQQFLRRFKDCKNEYNELINEGIILSNDGIISISFLDVQYQEATEKSLVNKRNGSKGGRPKKNRNETETKAKQKRNKSESKGIREDKIREDKNIIPDFVSFLEYARTKKPKVNHHELKLKYDSWVENGWKDGNDRIIKNWKSKLLNTLPYISEISSNQPNGLLKGQ